MPTSTVLAGDLIEAIGALRRQLRGRVGMPWPNADLSAAELELVRLVRRRPDIRIRAAAQELGVAANTVSTLVTRLTERGVLVRSPDPTDSRAACLRLTPTAQRRIQKWRDGRVSTLTSALGELPARDRALISAALPALDRLMEQLKENPKVIK